MHGLDVGDLIMVTCRVLAEDDAKEADEHTVDYSIIVTGNELLTGVYADGHTHFLTRTLRPLGLHCVGSMSVDDHAADIKQALQFACSHSQARHCDRRTGTDRLGHHARGACPNSRASRWQNTRTCCRAWSSD